MTILPHAPHHYSSPSPPFSLRGIYNSFASLFSSRKASATTNSTPDASYHNVKMTGKVAVHFGGGNIGRGFVGEKLFLSGYEVVFIDVVSEIIDSLQNTKSYTVKEIGEQEKINTITNYRAINSKTHEADVIDEISRADIVTCAVGPKVMQFIAPVIAKAIQKRTKSEPLAVIACENMVNATSALEGHIKNEKNTKPEDLASVDKKARFANSAIDRIVPAQPDDAGLNITIEAFFEWCVETKPWAKNGEQPPDIKAVHWVGDLEPYIERKLYTVNTSHAAAAYYGHERKKRTIHEVMQDPELSKIVRSAVEETSALIVKKHGIPEKEQTEYREKIIKRISNPYLEDLPERVGRAPLRKLGRQERFVGPAAPLAEMGLPHSTLLGCIEMAFRFHNVTDDKGQIDDESVELERLLKQKTPEEIVKDVCGLTPSDKLYPEVVEIVKKVQS